MELAKSFEPAPIEAHWYPYWERKGYFKAGLDRSKPDSYSILLPPPNVTGTLHMGHAFQHTLMDALTRRKRMQGYESLWLPGMDHAGIATQNKVEQQLAEEGKLDPVIGREREIERYWPVGMIEDIFECLARRDESAGGAVSSGHAAPAMRKTCPAAGEPSVVLRHTSKPDRSGSVWAASPVNAGAARLTPRRGKRASSTVPRCSRQCATGAACASEYRASVTESS